MPIRHPGCTEPEIGALSALTSYFLSLATSPPRDMATLLTKLAPVTSETLPGSGGRGESHHPATQPPRCSLRVGWI